MITDFGRNSLVTWTAEDLRKEREAEKEIQMRNLRGIPIGGKDFVYGWYIELGNHHLIADETTDWDNAGEIGVIEIEGLIEVIPETVGQSIIVEGKEFYEGDVTKDDVGDIGVVRFGKLPLDKSGDCVCTYPAFYIKCFGQLGQAPTYECQTIGEWMEIIGTIHTTLPELMDQENGK